MREVGKHSVSCVHLSGVDGNMNGASRCHGGLTDRTLKNAAVSSVVSRKLTQYSLKCLPQFSKVTIAGSNLALPESQLFSSYSALVLLISADHNGVVFLLALRRTVTVD